ncbi:hypothetical protein ACNOIU_03445 [Exiguobacterium mexicanum]|uniref:Glycosyl hydrolase family 4 C-terminal domain-containing protein n=1 Tax=Exiguobacterium mexicanum TaxID=340146 RepID=A0ABT7MMM0_9BACL|nr:MULTISPECIES: hypothetical protein [Exiguobacterium]MDL5376442.1 hypothetical protein [Exiguobacterium mexicanum]
MPYRHQNSPDDAVITKSGPLPITIGSLPLPIKGFITNLKTFEQLAIQEIISGSHHDAYPAGLMNPLIQDE